MGNSGSNIRKSNSNFENIIKKSVIPKKLNSFHNLNLKKQNDINFLIVGGSEAGKTTIYLQIQRILGVKLDNQTIEHLKINFYLEIINVVQKIYIHIENFENFDEKFKLLMFNFLEIYNYNNLCKDKTQISDILKSEKFFEKIEVIFNENDVINIIKTKKDELHIFDGFLYFCKNIKKIKPVYQPKFNDIIHMKSNTFGIKKTIINYNNKVINFYDTAYDFNKNRMETFDKVNLILFYVCAISEYNQMLCNDEKTNRLAESIDLFDNIINTKFKSNKICLIFNKIDLFKEKIKKFNLNDYFEDYGGDDDAEKAIEFLKHKFLSKNKYEKERILVFCTTAINNEFMDDLFNKIMDKFVNLN